MVLGMETNHSNNGDKMTTEQFSKYLAATCIDFADGHGHGLDSALDYLDENLTDDEDYYTCDAIIRAHFA